MSCAARFGEKYHQRDDRVRSAPAVRRREEERNRPRALGVRDPRIRQHTNRLDRARHQRKRVRGAGRVNLVTLSLSKGPRRAWCLATNVHIEAPRATKAPCMSEGW